MFTRASEVGGNVEPSGKKERKTVKVMAMVLGVFLVCYIPTTIFHSVVASRHQSLTLVLVSR